MDNEAQIDGELHSPQTMDEQRDQFTGAFFPQAQHFVVAGGNFNSVTNFNQAAPELPSDFRRFPMGDLDLRHEIRLGRSGEVYCQHERCSARRMYTARIHGSASDMTVALYQGDNAEEEWRMDISRYSRLRHPNVVQLFGMASACGMHAAIFNEELIPTQQLLDKYSGSHFRTVHLLSFLVTEFNVRVVRSMFNQTRPTDECRKPANIVNLYQATFCSLQCTMWIRPSTGRLCVDPMASEDSGLYLDYLPRDPPHSLARSILEPPEDSNIVDSLSLDRYHQTCDAYFGHQHQLSISINTSVQLGTVISGPPGSDIDHSNEIACSLDLAVHDWGWYVSTGASLTALDSGWIRVDSSEASNGYISRQIWATDGGPLNRAWLAQANHVFHRLGIASNHDDYVVMDEITYKLKISDGCSTMPPGYLFLCPLADLQLDIPSRFRLPDCPAYLSLDPSGAERLNMEEAEQLGFPTFKAEMKINGYSWNESVYTGIRQFHQAKGFNPDSLDVARELGYPLYEILKEPDGLCAHVEEIWDKPSEIQKFPASEPLQEGIHGESGPDLSPTQKGASLANDAATAELPTHWKIILGMQFALILALGALGMYDQFH